MKTVLLASGKVLVFFLLTVITCQYLPTKIYDLPELESFQGDHFYNPYADLDSNWLKGNFHAHAAAWMGLTNGHQHGGAVQKAYLKHGYDIPVVSDYYRLNPHVNRADDLYIPAYEHGSDIKKTHRQVIGAKKVDYYDITYSFNVHQRQYLLERTAKAGEVLVMNHPGLRNSLSLDEMKNLSGYHCIEVFNKHRYYHKHWDAALSAGKPAWLIANDDCHDVERIGNTVGTAWTMLNMKERSKSNILEALANGKTIGVQVRNDLSKEDHKKYRATNENTLQAVHVEGNSISITLEKPAEKIRLIGQNGIEKASIEQTNHIQYEMQEDDTYIRAEILQAHTNIILNPIIRYDGKTTPTNTLTASTDWLATWIMRMGIITADVLAILFMIIFPALRRVKSKKQELSWA